MKLYIAALPIILNIFWQITLIIAMDSNGHSTDMKDVSSIEKHLQLLRRKLHTSHSTCLQFFLGDNFGAGWNGAKLYIYDEDGNFDSYAPNKTGNHLNIKYCHDAESNVLTKSIVGSHIERKIYPNKTLLLHASMQYFHTLSPYSIKWTAINEQTGDIYTGNHMTRMVFKFHESQIDCVAANDLPSTKINPPQCKSCMIGKELPSSFNMTPESNIPSIKDNGDGRLTLRIRRASNDIMTDIGSSDLVTEMALYGFENTWFRSDGFGTTYEITDLTGSKVYFAGQLCSGDTGGLPCAISLEPGKYIWRVNGALDVHRDDIAWFFCDTQGGARSELFITIDESGKCIPGERKYSNDEDIDHDDNDNDNDIQEGYQPSSLLQSSSRIILLQGSFDLEGLSSQQLSDHEKTLLEYFIAAQFNELKSMNYNNNNNGNGNGEEEVEEKAKIHSWQEVVPYSYYNHEKGESAVIDRVTFTIPIHLDAYRAPGQFNSSTNELIANFKRYIGLTMSSGSFLSRLHHVRASNLQMITHVKFIDLIKLSEISPKSNTLTSDYSIFSEDFLLLFAVIFGLLFGVFVYKQRCIRFHTKDKMKV